MLDKNRLVMHLGPRQTEGREETMELVPTKLDKEITLPNRVLDTAVPWILPR